MLYHKNQAWKKKSSENCFDVIMGSYDGGKVCELVGNLVLSTLATSIPIEICGLYRAGFELTTHASWFTSQI